MILIMKLMNGKIKCDEDEEIEDTEDLMMLGNGNLAPIIEDGDKGDGNKDDNGSASFEEPKRDEANGADRLMTDDNAVVQPSVDPPKRYEAPVDDSEDHVPLQVRLERMQASSFDPQPLEVVPAQPIVKPKSNAQIMKEKLRLPSHGDSHVTNRPLDFTPPRIDIMQFVESQPGPSNHARSPPIAPVEVQPTPPSTNSDWSLSDIPEDEWEKIEHDAFLKFEMRKAREALVAETHDAVPHPSMSKELCTSKEPAGVVCPPSTSKEPASVSTVAPPSTSKEPASVVPLTTPASGNSSISPTYIPHPRRIQKKTVVLQSPCIDFSKKMTFRCSKAVNDLYNAVCAHGTRSATSKEAQDVVIINFWSFFATLGNLAASVKPRGKLMSPFAEVAKYILDDTKRKATKRVLPLRVSTYLLRGELDKSEVKRVFWHSENHLDHRQMVMFPVLQMLGDGATQVGHYFLLVLNLRNSRFEVLDSMRTLEDEALSNCCKILIGAIKELWTVHKYEANKPICNYEVEIGVPKQSNYHDCGFHMLMHAEYWDGHLMQYFKESDIPNIRKLLLYKWLTHKDNDARDWRGKLNL